MQACVSGGGGVDVKGFGALEERDGGLFEEAVGLVGGERRKIPDELDFGGSEDEVVCFVVAGDWRL